MDELWLTVRAVRACGVFLPMDLADDLEVLVWRRYSAADNRELVTVHLHGVIRSTVVKARIVV